MSINVKKYTKDQMAKMVEDAQVEVQESKREVADLKNKLNDTEAALGRANAELTYSVAEKNALRNDVTKMTDIAAFECRRADYAEAHPWRNLWAWVKRKMGCKA